MNFFRPHAYEDGSPIEEDVYGVLGTTDPCRARMGHSSQRRPSIEATNVLCMALSLCLSFAERGTPRFGRLRTAWHCPIALHSFTTSSRCFVSNEAWITRDSGRRRHGYSLKYFHGQTGETIARGANKGFRRSRGFGQRSWGPNEHFSPTPACSGKRGTTESNPGEHNLPFGTAYHVPVVCQEALEWLITDPEGVYVDCTLGGGGHSAALLDALGRRGRVVGLDRDPAALREASARLAPEAAAGRFEAIHANFADVTHVVDGCELLGRNGASAPAGVWSGGSGCPAAPEGSPSEVAAPAEDGSDGSRAEGSTEDSSGLGRDPEDAHAWAGVRLASTRDGFVTLPKRVEPVVDTGGFVDGILVDLGVSSRQIDDAARGFSFSSDGPLDMRMDVSGHMAGAAAGAGGQEDGGLRLDRDLIGVAASGCSSNAGRESVEDTPGDGFDAEGGGGSSGHGDDVRTASGKAGGGFSKESMADTQRGREALRSRSARRLDVAQELEKEAAPKAGRGVRRRRSNVASSAADLVNYADERDIRNVVWQYGDEKRSSKIARAIVVNRPIFTTGHLAEVVGSCVPPNERIKTLARVFQALRIKVNGELDALEALLEQARALVKPGGRLVVLSYHSLEDRRVKRVLATGNLKGTVVKDFYGNQLSPWKPLLRKPLTATPEEIASNPRARSVRLRVAERTSLS